MRGSGALFLFLLSVLAVDADEPPPLPPNRPRPEVVRQHYVLRGAGDTVLYEFTVIRRYTELKHDEVLLVRDPGHGDVIFESIQSWVEQQTMYRISDVRKRTFLQASFNSPFTSKTLRDTLEEAINNPVLGEVPRLITLTTNGGEWKTVETNLPEQSTLRQLRHDIRPSIDFFLLEAIERMRGALFQLPDGQLYFALLANYVIYDTSGEAEMAAPPEPQPPACDFDKSFGYPCSTEQLTRIRNAPDPSKLRWY
jgi:hypothetical protein